MGPLRDRLGRFCAVSCATTELGSLREGKTDASKIADLSCIFKLFFSHFKAYRKFNTNGNYRGSVFGPFAQEQGAVLYWKAGARLASWRRDENQGYAASRSARESREDHGTAAASATGSRGPRGSLPGPRLDAPCLPRLSRSPRWGRPKLSTTSTTRRHRIWLNCLCRRTKSL